MIAPEKIQLHSGLYRIQGPLVFVKNVDNVGLYDQVAVISACDTRLGRVVSISGNTVVVEVSQGTDGLSLDASRIRFLSKPVLLDVGPGMLGRVYNGVGEPIDGGPGIDVEVILHEAVPAQGAVYRNPEARGFGCRRSRQTADHPRRRQDLTGDVPARPAGWRRKSVTSCQANTPRLPDPNLVSRRW